MGTSRDYALDVFFSRSLIALKQEHGAAPLADFECPHGHLSNDAKITCGCFDAQVIPLFGDDVLKEAA